MAVTPFNADLASALAYVTAQVGTLTASTKPTSTLATTIWEQQYGELVLRLRRNGVGSSFDADSAGLLWVRKVEAYLTGGNVLLEKGSQSVSPLGEKGSGGDSTADRLLKMAEEQMSRLEKDRLFRQTLIAEGGAASNVPVSGFASSDWLDDRDTTINVTPGGGNVLYIPSVPVIQDGESL